MPVPRTNGDAPDRTTTDFAPGSWLVRWYAGGLNYQVEHHLFPRLSHVHYPRIAPVAAIRDRCHVSRHQTFGGARSHYRHLRANGREDARASAQTSAQTSANLVV
jgi:linoleoyl-CoA desaturase